AGSEYFERMKERRLYTINPEEVRRRVERMDLIDIFSEKLV
ncbi:MAG: glucose-inhibited division protein A, partial [Firmicutes bacterium]|nr:glucose-inhibited division protein A [Bacillota bacterium]